jgi:hypothetical protein
MRAARGLYYVRNEEGNSASASICRSLSNANSNSYTLMAPDRPVMVIYCHYCGEPINLMDSIKIIRDGSFHSGACYTSYEFNVVLALEEKV